MVVRPRNNGNLRDTMSESNFHVETLHEQNVDLAEREVGLQCIKLLKTELPLKTVARLLGHKFTDLEKFVKTVRGRPNAHLSYLISDTADELRTTGVPVKIYIPTSSDYYMYAEHLVVFPPAENK